ncbi:MAG: hypothetical protein ACUVT2_10020 [Thiobacillaceae bacterium]
MAFASEAIMFDASKQFVVKILSGEEKQATVRFPSDAEWCERAQRQRLVRRLLGRSKSQYEAVNSEAVEAELFARIRLNEDGASFDEAEAAKVIARLERVSVVAVERTGNRYRIELAVPGARTVHLLRIPSQKDVLEYSRASLHVTEGRRQQEIRVSLEPAGRLYDKLIESTTGYMGAVPIIHKSAAVSELLAEIEAEAEEEGEGF